MTKPIKKYQLLFIGSWLVARLLWTFERSRLILLRFFPRAQIQRVSNQGRMINQTEWIFEPPFLYTLTLDEDKNNFIFTRVSEIIRN